MGKQYQMELKLEKFRKSEGKDALRRLLLRCCDEDFNGNNGKEYFVEACIDGVNVEVSPFDACWDKVKDSEEKNIIESVLKANYAEDWDYIYSLEILDRPDEIIFALALSY